VSVLLLKRLLQNPPELLGTRSTRERATKRDECSTEERMMRGTCAGEDPNTAGSSLSNVANKYWLYCDTLAKSINGFHAQARRLEGRCRDTWGLVWNGTSKEGMGAFNPEDSWS
jgi:hypothetical protein